MEIRLMSQRDVTAGFESLLDLAVLANPFATRERYGEFVVQLFHDFPSLAFVATDEANVVGYVMGDLDVDKGEIEDIAVLPQYRGKGLGRKLLETELSALKEHGARRVVLWVHWRNSAAIPFYYRFSFRVTHIVRDRTGKGEDAIYLEKEL